MKTSVEHGRTRTTLRLTLENRPAGDEWKPRAWLLAECRRFGEGSVGRFGRILRGLVADGTFECRETPAGLEFRAVPR